MKRLEIGDVFEVKIPNGKKYMQYIGDDSSQLNSTVVRVLKSVHPAEVTFNFNMLNTDETESYVHVTDIREGEKLGLWEKVANCEVLDKSEEIVFKSSIDWFANRNLEFSENWYVWYINDEEKPVSHTDDLLKKANLGLVVSPDNVYEMIENGGIYPGVYPKHK